MKKLHPGASQVEAHSAPGEDHRGVPFRRDPEELTQQRRVAARPADPDRPRSEFPDDGGGPAQMISVGVGDGEYVEPQDTE